MKTLNLATPYLITFLALTVTSGLYAIDWSNGTGSTFWGDTGNWTGAVVPNAIDVSARIPTSSSNQVVVLGDSAGADASFTIGSYSIGTVGGAPIHNYRLNNVASGSGRLIFDKSSGNASLAFNNIFADATMSINVGLTLNDNLAIFVGRGSGTYQINGQISSGSGLTTGIIMSGSGTIQIGGSNNYTGSTTIDAGTIKLITGNDRLSTTTDLVLNGGASAAGTLDLNTRNQNVASLSGTSNTVLGKITNSAAGTGTATLTVESTTISSTFEGIIQNGATAKVALTKAGAGTSLTLSGANSYSGATTINGGTLALGAADRIADSSALVLGGGTFATGGFSETLDTLTLNSSSTIDFGSGTSNLVFAASNGITWTGSLTLLNFDIGTDSLRFGSSVSALSTAQLESISLLGHTASLDASGFVTFAAIPEPSTYALFLGAGAALLAGTRRRRRR